MTSLKRSSMALALLVGVLGSVAPPAAAPVHIKTRRQPSPPPPIRRYKADTRVVKAKQDDQPAKEARRAARQANDAQTRARQEAKWGKQP